MMNPKMPKIGAPTPSMPHMRRGGSLASARRKLARGGAVTPPSKKTVDMVEKGRVVVRHTFYGRDPGEAQHMMNSHKKADKSFADAVAGKKYKGIDIKAVKRARGGSIPGYDDGGAIPSYDEYLASSAAPKGLDADQYPIDYERYAGEVENANQPYFGDPQAEVHLGVLGKSSDPRVVSAVKDNDTKNFGALAGGALAGAVPFAVPGAVARVLGATWLGQGLGIVPKMTPSWGTISDAIDNSGLPSDNKFWDYGNLIGLGARPSLKLLRRSLDTQGGSRGVNTVLSTVNLANRAKRNKQQGQD